MNKGILTYIIQNDLQQLNIEKFQIEEINQTDPEEIKVSSREMVYVHYVNAIGTLVSILFDSDDNHFFYNEQNMRAIDKGNYESSFIHKYLSTIKIKSTCNFFVQYFKIRF